jgi:hypothetical protein
MWMLAALAALAARPEPTCDATLLEVSLDALAPGLETPTVIQLTAADVLDACTLDHSLEKALDALAEGKAPADADLKGRALKPICNEKVDDREGVWTACELGTAGLVSRPEWDAATGTVVLPIAVFDAMRAIGTRRDIAQVVFRRLAGVPARSPGPGNGVIDTFEPLFPGY